MVELTTNSKHFTRQFNALVPEAPSKLTSQDVMKLTELGFIKRYEYYWPSQDREKRQDTQKIKGADSFFII
ncbi:hypothetical protein ACFLWD_02915 [Chloroflexota bacterium]